MECPWRTPERILTYGGQGAGKSNAILAVARRCPQSTFYVIDADMSESYNRALDMEYSDLTNVVVLRVDPDDFMQMLHTIKAVRPMIGRDDWLVVDGMTVAWASVQGWFIDEFFDMNDDEYFIAVRQEKLDNNAKKGSPLAQFEGFMDWPVINKRYKRLTSEIYRTKGHLYLTAEAGPLGKDDDQHVRNLFGGYGVKANGQKQLGFGPSTVLLLTQRRDTYELTSVKDRNRQRPVDMVFDDFGKDYLQKIAGWKPKPLKTEGVMVDQNAVEDRIEAEVEAMVKAEAATKARGRRGAVEG